MTCLSLDFLIRKLRGQQAFLWGGWDREVAHAGASPTQGHHPRSVHSAGPSIDVGLQITGEEPPGAPRQVPFPGKIHPALRISEESSPF